MRLLTSVLTTMLLIATGTGAFGQTAVTTAAPQAIESGSYPIPGSHLLQAENQKVLEYIAQHPESVAGASLRKTSAWNFTVGSTHTWKSINVLTNVSFDVPSTCRAVGTHCYVFVEDASWGTRVDQSAVDAVVNAFDNQTPANSSKGVYQMDVETFGDPPDIDGDPKIIILILDIQDGFSGSGAYVAGYFWSGNEIQNYPNGNNAEIYYLDSNPVNLTTTSGVNSAMSTTAHEFQHMIHFARDRSEAIFVNEGCSCFAEANCGYGIYPASYYVNETNHALFDWRSNSANVINDYSRAARFFQYVGDQFGAGVFMPIVASTLTGIPGIDAGLTTFGANRTFAQIFQDWLVANILDDRTVNTNYGYDYPSLPKAVGKSFTYPVVSLTQGSVAPLAAQYLSYTGGADLRITFTTASSSIVVKAIEIGTPSRVLDVTPGAEFHEPAFGSTYSAVHFVVMNTSQSSSATFSYQSSGRGSTTQELRYDLSEPTSYLSLQEGDTAAVWFDGVPGARLDSVRVALQRTGTITGGVYRSTGTQNPTPLGAQLTGPITVNRTDPTSPWVKIDLQGYAVDAGSNFAVAFAGTGIASANPRVMVVKEPDNGTFHSYTYYTETSPKGWYVLTTSAAGDSAFAYSVRAYLSFGATGVTTPAEQLPTVTKLEPNYPNPFNPLTIIKYTIAGNRDQGSGPRKTTLVVYDVLGRQVATLVDEEKGPGIYEAKFDGRGLASGVYYYRLTAGSYVESRKMVLMK